MCGKLVSYPAGFELDHIEPLKADGGRGEDEDVNTQVLCILCHAKKTAADMGYRYRAKSRAKFDAQGRVVW